MHASPTSIRSSSSLDLSPEPDLNPIFPTAANLSIDLSSHSGLDPHQKQLLVSHSLTRACVYGELSVLQFLLLQPEAQMYVDLSVRDEDGVGLVSLSIHGFGSESERDVEREECVRLLISQGADLNADNAGWTPLHHAALLSPPTLVSYLMTHGCSPFATTQRGLTPLDIVTAHSIIPGRADVALLLEEAMRGEGWTGGRMEEKRRQLDVKMKRKGIRDHIREDVGKHLGIEPSWWKDREEDLGYSSLDESDEEDDGSDENDRKEEREVYTPPADYTSMLVFSPTSLPHIYESLITNYSPSFRDCQPANLLYMLARFACLTCDHIWLEDFMLGATECIEDVFFNRPDDITCLVFWLRNCTIWLHLMQCDESIAEVCEMLGSFELIEETINSVFVFIIRLAERKVDSLLDGALLDHSQFVDDSVQFESEWSIFRSFKKKAAPPPSAQSTLRGSPLPPTPSSPGIPGGRYPPQSPVLGPNYRPPSPSPSIQSFSSSIRQSLSPPHKRSGSITLQSLFNDPLSDPEKATELSKLTNFLTAFQTLLVLSNVNPALITQLWSQVMYWTACEMFNRVLTRKKYLCRSRAVQIGINLSVLEEWVIQMGLPRGVQSHLTPVRELLHWLQCLSSITEFPNLVATIQTMKNINPLQMRRAVRDYKYEVNEGRMTEECIQYLTQLQKDWERHRVKLGVEALRKEQLGAGAERDRSVSPNDTQSIDHSTSNSSIASSNSSDAVAAQESIDLLFDRNKDKSEWEPVSPPKALGELLDSRYMLPLVFPTDPRILGALPGGSGSIFGEMGPGEKKYGSVGMGTSPTSSSVSRSESRASNASHGAMKWRSRDRKLRDVGASSLKWVDGVSWARREGINYQVQGDPEGGEDDSGNGIDDEEGEQTVKLRVDTLTRKPSGRSKGRPSQGETTPVRERSERSGTR